jgi:hypothetical protein
MAGGSAQKKIDKPTGKFLRSRSDITHAPAEMLSLAPTESPERALERSAAGTSEEAAADPGNPDRLMDKKPPRSAGSRPRERAAIYSKDRGVSRTGRGHYKPAGELDRAYALDRSYGPKGFWDWSR